MKYIFKQLDNQKLIFKNYNIHIVIDINDRFWFRGVDVARVLDYVDVTDTIKKKVDKDDKIQMSQLKLKNNEILSGHKTTYYINESGLYTLIMKSHMPKAKEFQKWVTSCVLPSIQKYGTYIQGKKSNEIMKETQKKLKDVQEINRKIQKELDKYKIQKNQGIMPSGGIVYVIDCSEGKKTIFRIGRTTNMKARKSVYDTHNFKRKNLAYSRGTPLPLRMENCLRFMLDKFRIEKGRDFYSCSLETIKKAIKKCENNFKFIDNQKGGSSQKSYNFIDNKINKYKKIISVHKNKLFEVNIKLSD